MPDGRKEAWAIEAGTPNVLFRRGFTKDALKAGTALVIDGLPRQRRLASRQRTQPDAAEWADAVPSARRATGAHGSDPVMCLHNLMQWMADTRWSVGLHESRYAYSIVESVHVWTLCVFVGFAVFLDLRLLGVTLKRRPDLAD
jgi:hypothetical protein